MLLLPSDFVLDRYGINLRLVKELDAEFILNLRTDSRSARFISETSNALENQILWTRKYKEREAKGLDYYFMYSVNGERMGVNRLYDITEDEFTGGSFVFKPGCPFEIPVLATLIQLDLGFNVLDKKLAHGDIRLGNHKVIKYHQKILKVDFTYTDELNQYYIYTREAFNARKPIIESMLNV